MPGLTVVEGAAPAALAGLPAPDAIFIGGGGTDEGVLDAAIAALPANGRLVANAVTLEMEALLLAKHARTRRRTGPHRDCARDGGRRDEGLAAGDAGHAMVVGEAMIVAGVGCKKGVTVAEVLAAIETALEAHGLTPAALSLLATARMKGSEAGIIAAGAQLNLPVILVDDGVLREMSVLSHSDLSLAVAGTPSVSEAAALAAAGEGARLAGPRTVVGPVTCAIAFGGDDA